MTGAVWSGLHVALLCFASQALLAEQSAEPGETQSVIMKFWKPGSVGKVGTFPTIKIGTPTTLDPDGRRYAMSSQMQRAYTTYFRWFVAEFGGVLVNGTRHMIDLHYVDDASDASTAGWAAQLLVDQGIRLFLGPYSSTLTRPVAQVIQAAGGVQVASGSSYSDVFAGRPNIFGTLPRRENHAESALEQLGVADGGSRKTLWMVTLDYDLRDLTPLCAQQNIDLLNVTRIPEYRAPGELDQLVQSTVETMRSASPDIVMARVDRDLCHSLVNRMWKMHYVPKALVLVVCPAGVDFTANVGTAGQYAIHQTPWLPSPDLTGPLTGSWTALSFWSDVYRSTGLSPGYQVASAFVGAATLVHGIERADSLDPQAVADAIRTMDAGSLFGRVSFDGNGQNEVKMQVTQYQMTSSALLIYPCTQCTAALVYPRPSRSSVECAMTDSGVRSRFGWLDGRCQECPLGRQSVVDPNVSRRVCQACPEGSMGRDGDFQSCIPCFSGSFSDKIAAQDCAPCSPGKFAGMLASRVCSDCPEGHFSAGAGMSECPQCQPGTYQNGTGQSSCNRCEAGKFGQQPAATGCQNCPPTLSTQGTGFVDPSECGCPAGAFSTAAWDASRPAQCEPCSKGIRCPGFGAPLEVEPGYYAEAGSFSPLEGVWLCAKRDACPGGPPGTCSGDLEGIACSLCPVGRSLSGTSCVSCHDQSFLVPVLLGVVVVSGLVMLYYFANGKVVRRTSVQLGGSITLGIVVTAAQLFGMLYRLNIPWPPELEPLMQGCSAMAMDSEVLSMGCSVGRDPARQYLSFFIAPFVLAGTLAFLALASRWLPLVSQDQLRPWTYPRVFNTFCSFLQTLFIAIAGIAAASLQCYSHPNGKQTMVEYPSVVCYEGAHLAVLAQGVLLLVFVVIPFLAVCVWGSYSVFRSTNEKGALVAQLEMYRFLIFRFKPMTWWWSNVFNVRQVLLGLAPMITPDDPSFQLAFVAMVLLVYLVLLARCMPWRSPELNVLDLATTGFLAQVVIILCGLLPATSSTGRLSALVTVVVAFVVTILMVAVAYCIILLRLRGRFADFGLQFPLRSKEVERFADEWQKLARKVGKLSPAAHRDLICEMGYYERVAIDNVMCIVTSCFDTGRGSVWQEVERWSSRAKTLRLHATYAKLKEDQRLSGMGISEGTRSDSFYTETPSGKSSRRSGDDHMGPMPSTSSDAGQRKTNCREEL